MEFFLSLQVLLIPSCMAVFDWSFYLFQPERIDPSASRQGYDVRSDVWSLGITLVSEWGLKPLLRCTFLVSTLGALCSVME